MVGNGDEVSSPIDWPGGDDQLPEPRETDEPGGECGYACEAYCEGLGLENPLNIGLCPQIWGVGLEGTEIDHKQACRRLFVDMMGRLPSPTEVNTTCNQDSWGDVVRELVTSDEFAFINQRRWADHMLYNNRAVNVERAYDMDDLVGKTYRGLVAWDQFAQVTSAHPILVRRYDTAGDRVDFMFEKFLGRPPYDQERSDMSKLYALWINDYVDHAHLDVLPDAYIEYKCVDEMGHKDPANAGACTSVQWGYNELVLEVDHSRIRDDDGLLWSGNLYPDEWEQLQAPGRVMTTDPQLRQLFWTHTVDQIMEQYLGYDLGTLSPGARKELKEYLLQFDGDIRAAHFAMATSFVYLQSSQRAEYVEDPYLFGPLKQIEVEPWIDSIKAFTEYDLATCDHRLPHPEDYLEEEFGPWAKAMVKNSRWMLDEEDEVRGDYRNLARTLGGCPSNEVSGRFTPVSILNTAVQESFVADVCDPGLQGYDRSVSIDVLLPEGMNPTDSLNEDRAEQILTRQTRLFLGREPTQEELDEARALSNECTPKPCTVEAYARPVCFALMSSSEMLFY